MAERRKDVKGRNLKDGEDQMPDDRYRFRYIDKNGQRQAVQIRYPEYATYHKNLYAMFGGRG